MSTKWLLTFLGATALFGANSIGSVSSMGPVEVGGTTLSAATVSSWPLVAGDVIATTKSPAVVFITGKGRVTLEANSRVKVEREGDKVSVRLLGGAVAYDLMPGSDLIFLNGLRSIAPAVQPSGALKGSLVTPGVTAQVPDSPHFGTGAAVNRPKPSIVGP